MFVGVWLHWCMSKHVILYKPLGVAATYSIIVEAENLNEALKDAAGRGVIPLAIGLSRGPLVQVKMVEEVGFLSTVIPWRGEGL